MKSPARDGPRGAAAQLVGLVLRRRAPLDEAEAMAGPALSGLPPSDRAMAKRLTLTALRRLGEIDALLAERLREPLPEDAAPIEDVLRILAAEVVFLGAAPHAAVGEAVTLAKKRNRRFSGLVNAIGRRLAEGGTALALAAAAAGRRNTPDGLMRRLAGDWGVETADAIAKAHAIGAPLDLTPRDPAAAVVLADALSAGVTVTGSVRARPQGRITDLPGFDDGDWWVQDAAAALPAHLLAPTAGERVLDLCAAPGGKTLQFAAAGARVTALDASAARAERLRENLARTRLSAEIVIADATDWDAGGAQFDAVLLDAPCSATGTIRRHPDLPWIKPLDDLAPLTALQDALLDAAWARVRPGGRLVYCVCSILRDEGEARAAAAASRWTDAETPPIAPTRLSRLVGVRRPEDEPGDAATLAEISGGLGEGRIRTLPSHWASIGGLDGFFAQLWVKRG